MCQQLEGFDKTQRLLKPAQFKLVFEKRQSAHNDFFGIYAAKNSLNHSRLGLVVSKKVSKKAVIRNRIKRQIREVFRRQQKHLGSFDFVVIAKFPLAKTVDNPVNSKLHDLWQKAINRCKK